jgi:hypothetical protein
MFRGLDNRSRGSFHLVNRDNGPRLLAEVICGLLIHGSVNGRRKYRAHPDCWKVRQLLADRGRQTAYGELACDIGAEVGLGSDAQHRRNVDQDAAIILLTELPKCRLASVHVAHDVVVQNLPKGPRRNIFEASEEQHCSAVDPDIDPAERAYGFLPQPLHRRLIRDVGSDGESTPAGRPALFNDSVEGILVRPMPLDAPVMTTTESPGSWAMASGSSARCPTAVGRFFGLHTDPMVIDERTAFPSGVEKQQHS